MLTLLLALACSPKEPTDTAETGDTADTSGFEDTADSTNVGDSSDTSGDDTADTSGKDTGGDDTADTGIHDTGGDDTADTGIHDTGDTGRPDTGDTGRPDTGEDTGRDTGEDTAVVDTGEDTAVVDTGDTGTVDTDTGGSDTGGDTGVSVCTTADLVWTAEVRDASGTAGTSFSTRDDLTMVGIVTNPCSADVSFETRCSSGFIDSIDVVDASGMGMGMGESCDGVRTVFTVAAGGALEQGYGWGRMSASSYRLTVNFRVGGASASQSFKVR